MDVAGQSIVEILLRLQHPTPDADRRGLGYTVHNIVNPHRVPWKDLVGMLQSSEIAGKGKRMRQVSIVEWVGLLNRAADEGMSADELPGLRLLGFFQDMATSASKNNNKSSSESMGEGGEEGIVFDTAESQLMSPALAACESYQAKWLEASVRKWKEDEFIQ